MKKLILPFLFMLTTIIFVQAQQPATALAQEETASIEGLFHRENTKNISTFKPNAFSSLPQFPGGKTALKAFMAGHTKYPELASYNGIEGTVTVQIIVAADGSLSNFKVIGQANEALKEAAVKVVQAMPNWKPAMQQGRTIKCKVNVPVAFSLR